MPPNRKTPTSRRTVILSKRTTKGKSSGRTRLWAFGYQDLADLFGVEEKTVRNWVAAKYLDPADLERLCRRWVEHTWRKVPGGELPP